MKITELNDLVKLQNQWVAFSNDNKVILNDRSFTKLIARIPKKLQDKVELTFINPANKILSP